jgi:hypothetical protein
VNRPAVSMIGACAMFVASLSSCTAATVRAADDGYISNPQEEVFVKVPKEWKQFTINPLNEFGDSRDNARLSALPRSTNGWSRMADGSATPSERNSEKISPDDPVVVLSVLPLPTDWQTQGTEARDGISLSVLRSLGASEIGAGADPIEAFKGGDPTYEVVSYSDQFLADARVWGGHLRMNYRYETDPEDATLDKWATVDYWGLVDVMESKLYRLTVKCSASCFVANRAQLDQISSSFRIKGQNVPRVGSDKPPTRDLKVNPSSRSDNSAAENSEPPASPPSSAPAEENNP